MFAAKIRPAQYTDYKAVSELGDAVYAGNYEESAASVASKITGYPAGCFVADLDGVIGYILSFPYRLGQSYPLNATYEPVAESDCYYIHDLCVAPEFRRKGVASELLEPILAQKWPVIGLVAVQGSSKFWRLHGFLSFAAVQYNGKKAEYMLRIAA